ncbi:MAG: trimethylamine methyltransferase family protein [Thermoleophilia bacterium]|nr:trimethylamine methyltransferase family protein [Thermoleophilia bacterium]
MEGRPRERERRRRRPATAAAPDRRSLRYRSLESPFAPLELLSADEVAHLHASALELLRRHGIRVLLPEARGILREAGALVDDETELVRFEAELVGQAVASAPSSFELIGRSPERTVTLGGRHLATVPVSSPPAVSDLDGGKRDGNLADFRDLVRLTQHFDVMHVCGPCVEPQDVPLPFRHLQSCLAYLTLTDKAPYLYARGRGQVADGFEMFRIGYGVDAETFRDAPRSYTVINSNSPRQLDIPMCMGLIDFAAAGQLSVITPFTLAGAMAPVTLAGALTLQHAEALAGITLTQAVRPGAPVVYGAFTSNVDMKSGSPAFGTPEYFKAALASGQLARHIGLPYRSSAPNASNAVDGQAMYETMTSLYGAVLGGCNLLLHAAGWLEGGLTASKEKFVLDVEVLQMLAESFQPVVVDDTEIGLDAIGETPPGGHFFGGAHTLDRYRTAFYEPLVSDWSNHGQWVEAGSRDATTRANGVWKRVLAEFAPPPLDDGIAAELDEFVARRTTEGGAPPES